VQGASALASAARPQPDPTVAGLFLGILGAMIFAAAAYSFGRSASIDEPARTWLIAAFVLASVSHLHYMLVPTIYTNWLSTGDLLRLAMSALLLAALIADVRRSYVQERERAEQLDAAYRLARDRASALESIDRAKAHIVRMLAHELLHPIATLRALAVALDRGSGTSTDAERRALLDGLLEQTSQLGTLAVSAPHIAELSLDMFSLELRRHAVGDIMASVERAYAHAAAPVRVARHGGDESKEVVVDLPRILQVFHNLLSNAAKFGPSDMPVDVDVRAEGRVAIFTVRDRGPGIDAADAGRVFEQYTRLRGDSSEGADGQGLGLYISRLIVEAHSGSIWVERPDGAGVTFAFSIPLAEDALP
jgi:signal transduction histidine kinase